MNGDEDYKDDAFDDDNFGDDPIEDESPGAVKDASDRNRNSNPTNIVGNAHIQNDLVDKEVE